MRKSSKPFNPSVSMPRYVWGARAIGEFFNELLDQQIRFSLDAEFAPLRTLIVAQAFSEGNLLPADADATPGE